MPAPDLIAQIQHLAAERSQSIAIQTSTRDFSYADLWRSVARRAEQLQASMARVIALQAQDPFDWISWDLAALSNGQIVVPVPGFFTVSQVAHLLDQTGADLFVGVPVAGLELADLGFVPAMCGWQRPQQQRNMPTGTQKITFTSGTTGSPKGVCLSADAMLQVAQAMAQATDAQSIRKHLSILPLAVLLENVGVYAALLRGAAVQFAEVNVLSTSVSSIRDFVTSVARTDANSMILVPQLLEVLLSASRQGFVLPSSFRFIAIGGAKVSQLLLDKAAQKSWPVYEGYGLSECASVVSLNRPGLLRRGSAGRPLPHVQVQIAEDGEILVSGNTFLGYLGSSEPAPAYWPTGDLGYLQDGYLYINGRKKNQFITAFGRNVSPEWVETELTAEDAIAQAFVYGESLPFNIAIVTPAHADVSSALIQAAVDNANHRLPVYAQIGRWVRSAETFSVANGQLTVNGRLKRSAIYDRYFSTISSFSTSEESA